MTVSQNIKLVSKWLVLSCAIGLLAGLADGLFLYCLDQVITWNHRFAALIWLLPVVGVVSAWLYRKAGRELEDGVKHLIRLIRKPEGQVSLYFAPLILLTTLLSHLFGASVGREGVAVQIGGGLAGQVARLFKLPENHRKILLMAGMSAGFGGLFGVPVAGGIFSYELVKGQNKLGLPLCLLASFVGNFTVLSLGVIHETYSKNMLIPELSFKTAGAILVIGLICAAGTVIFLELSHFIYALKAKFGRHFWLPPIVGGGLLGLGYLCTDFLRYRNMGRPLMVGAFEKSAAIQDALYKISFTALSLGSGFKGGEVTPLFVIGSLLGSWTTQWNSLPVEFCAALGFAAVFSGAAKLPVTCSVIAFELFGPTVGLYAIVPCLISYLISGGRGIYHAVEEI